jgi:hypothetical protein
MAHGLPGRPRPARPATARRVSAHRSCHRSPGAWRGMAGGGATVVEVEQKMALQHPRRRGYPLGMGVEAIAHRSPLSTGRGRKTGSTTAFSDEARALVAGGGPVSGWRERELGSTFHGRKSGKRGLGFRSPWKSSRRRRRPDSDGGALRQRRSAPDTDNSAVGTSAREVRRGDDATQTAGRRGRDGCRDAGERSRQRP